MIRSRSTGHPSIENETSAVPTAVRTESPFIVGNPITRPHQFFGRERVIKRLFNLLKTHPLQNAAIIGAKRSGKTSLLNYLRAITTTPAEQLRPGQRNDWLPNPGSYRWVFINFQDPRAQTRQGLMQQLLAGMELPVPPSLSLEHFMDAVSGHVHRPTVILMDEVGVGLQRCPELDDTFWESLRALATNQTDGNLSFVLSTHKNPIELAGQTGHSSPFFNIFGYSKVLGPLTTPEAKALINNSPIPFSPEDIDWILEHSRCWPIALQRLCQERLFNLEEENLSEDWKADGLEQITQYQHLRGLS